MLQALIEMEAAQAVKVLPSVPAQPRADDHRNGHRERTLSTKADDLELRIPKLRQGSFFSFLLEPRRRIDRALWAVVMEAYVHGVSTRKVDDLVRTLGIDAGARPNRLGPPPPCSSVTGALTRLDLDAQIQRRLFPGCHEVAEARFVRRALRHGYHVLDIGAIGSTSGPTWGSSRC